MGSDRLTFRRLLRVILPNLPRTSAFKRAIDPTGSQWDADVYVLADIADALFGANWQRANEGSKNPSPRPAPYPRPGDQEAQASERERRITALLAQKQRAMERGER